MTTPPGTSPAPVQDSAEWSDTQRWLAALDADTVDNQINSHTDDSVDLDGAPDSGTTANDAAPAPDNTDDATSPDESRFGRPVAIGFAAATAVVTLVVTATLLGMRSDPQPPQETSTATTQISVLPPAPSPTAQDADQDAPIPYTASASCPPGSTATQALAGDDPTRAWVCVRDGVDGQVLTLDLGRTMVVTAVSITPGWVGADSTGEDQWHQHRIVSRVQWIFNDDASTVAVQRTGAVRGEAVQAIPHRGVLASSVTMVVLETVRAPQDSPTTPTPNADGGLLEDILGPPLTPPTTTGETSLPALPPDQAAHDPADHTFAVSSIKVLGHPPV